MAKWKLHLLQFVVWMLIMAGISAIWRFTDVAMYGESQHGKRQLPTKKGFLICPASGMEIMADDFCSYGERREGE
jgi:hypothetical protein